MSAEATDRTTAQDVAATVDAMSRELDRLSAGIAHVARELEPVEKEYTDFVDAFELGLWQKHVDNDEKLPSEKLRRQLAHRAMDPTLYGRYFALVHSRDRMVKRVSALKTTVEAQRSILSAMKEGII